MYTVCVCVAIDLTQQSAELFCRLHQINRDAAAFAAVLDVVVWCGMSEICLKLKVLAKIDFIVFLACLGVK